MKTVIVTTTNLEDEIKSIRALEAKIAELDELKKEKENITFEVWNEFYSTYYNNTLKPLLLTFIKAKEETLFLKFLRVLASKIGTLMDYKDVAYLVGINSKMVNLWLEKLEELGIIYLLPAYQDKISKLVEFVIE